MTCSLLVWMTTYVLVGSAMPDPLTLQECEACEREVDQFKAKRKLCESGTSNSSSNVSMTIRDMKGYFRGLEQQMRDLNTHPEKAELQKNLQEARAKEAELLKSLNKAHAGKVAFLHRRELTAPEDYEYVLMGTGQCVDESGLSYDAWYGPSMTYTIQDCKNVCSNEPDCVGIETYTEASTVCNVRFRKGSVPDPIPAGFSNTYLAANPGTSRVAAAGDKEKHPLLRCYKREEPLADRWFTCNDARTVAQQQLNSCEIATKTMSSWNDQRMKQYKDKADVYIMRVSRQADPINNQIGELSRTTATNARLKVQTEALDAAISSMTR